MSSQLSGFVQAEAGTRRKTAMPPPFSANVSDVPLKISGQHFFHLTNATFDLRLFQCLKALKTEALNTE